jgi:hypothetical protein
MTEDDLRTLALALPGVEEGFSLKSVSFAAKGKILARLLGDGEAMLTGFDVDQIDHLIARAPETFHASQHFRDARCIAVRLDVIDADEMAAMLDRRWREIAPKAAVKARGELR